MTAISPPAPVGAAPLAATPQPTGAAVETLDGLRELVETAAYLREWIAKVDATEHTSETRAYCLGSMLGAAEAAAQRIDHALRLLEIGERYR